MASNKKHKTTLRKTFANIEKMTQHSKQYLNEIIILILKNSFTTRSKSKIMTHSTTCKHNAYHSPLILETNQENSVNLTKAKCL